MPVAFIVPKIKALIQTDFSSLFTNSFTICFGPFAGYFLLLSRWIYNSLCLFSSVRSLFTSFLSSSLSTPFPVYIRAPIPGSFSATFPGFSKKETFTASEASVKFLMTLTDVGQRERETGRCEADAAGTAGRWAVGVSVYVRSNYRAASFDGST